MVAPAMSAANPAAASPARQPRREQADRSGQFECSDEVAEPLACSDQAELLH
jgi:hypothetical protein